MIVLDYLLLITLLQEHDFASFIAKIKLLRLPLLLSVPAAGKTQCIAHLSFNSTLQLISGISRDLQKLLKHFNSMEIVAFFRNILALFWAGWATVIPNNLAS